MITLKHKRNMLKYLVGDCEDTPGDTHPETSQVGTINTSIDTIISNYEEVSASNYKILYHNDKIIVYNSQYVPVSGGGPRFGFILLLDKDLNELAFWDYIPGSTTDRLYPICGMGIDGDGNFYAVSEDTASNASVESGKYNDDKRLILLNDFTLSVNGSYELKIRKTYFLQNQDTTLATGNKAIVKAPNDATYYIASVDSLSQQVITRVKINVGSENEWTDFTTTTLVTSFGFDAYFSLNGSNYDITYGGLNTTLDYVEFTISEDTLTEGTTVDLPIEAAESVSMNGQVLINSTSVKYAVVPDVEALVTYIFKITDSSYSQIAQYTATGDYEPWLKMNKVGELIFLQKTLVNENSQLGLLYNDTIYWQEAISGAGAYMQEAAITNSYNLYTIYFYPSINSEDITYKYQVIYNSAGYYGTGYYGIDGNAPQYGTLKATSSSNEYLFARNIYNLSLRSNTATTTFQVPNTLVNNTQIECEGIFGNSNLQQNEESQTFSKNIYETMNINISNTWKIINQNDASNPIENEAGEIRLTSSAYTKEADATSDYDKYESTQIQKYCLITDSTGDTFKYGYDEIKKLTDSVYRYTIKLTIPSDVTYTKLEMISNDDNTTYQTIDLSSLESGKSYIIRQTVRVDDTEDNLIYNSQNVYYNNEQVTV